MPVIATTPAAVVAGVVNTNAPGFDLVLLAHVISAVVGLVAVALAGISALALRRALARGGSLPEALVRYYRPGVNWAGRVLFLVPVLGVALLAMSGGQWSFADTWVSLGMVIWVVIAMVAESVLWPIERRLQQVVSGADVAERGGGGGSTGEPIEVAGWCLRAGVVGLALGGALVFVGVLMVAQP